MIVRSITSTLGLLVAGMWLGLACVAKANKHPHILIILVDDMGYGDPGCFNPQSKIRTPNIDQLASEGMKFTDAHAPGPLCHASRYGLLTGRYPFRTDVSKWTSQPLIEEDQVTIASLLRNAGYLTAMVGKWHLGFSKQANNRILSEGPIERGFEYFFGIPASTDIPPYFYIRGDRATMPPSEHIAASSSEAWSPIQGKFWREGMIAADMDLSQVMQRFTDEAISIIKNHNSDKPLMLYLAYPAPHTPWMPAPEFRGKSGAGLYGDFVMMTDHEVGRVCTALDAAGMSEETLLVFTSDNGPVWYPQDIQRFGHDAAGGLRGMKGDAWEAGHRMPFIVRWPGRVEAASQNEQTICFTDLMATLADLLASKLPADAGPDSFSFYPVLCGRPPAEQPGRGPIVMQSGSSGAMMIRSGDWKLINQPGSGGFSKSPNFRPGDPPGQLYNLREDPSEKTNLYEKNPELVAQLSHLMKQIIESPITRPN